MPEDDAPLHCHGCGRLRAVCAMQPCGRGREHDPSRFCTSCGWRLRQIAVVPGQGGLWCRAHGVQPDYPAG